MIRYWKNTVAGILSLFLIGFLACKKSAPTKVQLTPLQTLLNTDTSLSLYHLLLLRANDAGLLKDTAASLLMARNDVLIASGYPRIIIDSMSSSLADRIVRYNYLPSGVSLDSAGVNVVPTRLGVPLYVEQNGNQLVLNGSATADGTPVAVGKASVYWLTAMVPPAADSLPNLLGTDSTLTYLNAVFTRTNLYDSLLQTGSYTLLAPVNSAFQQAGYDSIGAIDSANIDTLVHLAMNQVVRGAYFTTGFPGTVTTLSGGSVTVTVNNGIVQFAGAGNMVPVHWLTGDNVAGPTIILHKTDGIIDP
ncbi:MAG TPA: fasciclin domain-containing protein [Puia sp.]|nr:fasciclin domain-containing protein [Puia sp.]